MAEDYNKKIHNAAREIAHELLPILNEEKEKFIPDQLEENPEKLKVQEEYNMDLGQKVLTLLATKDIPVQYATLAIDKIMENLSGLKTYLDGTFGMFNDEYLSRSLGKKNEEGKYRREAVTVGELMLKLDEVKKATGNRNEDYFNEVAPEMPSPYAEKLADKE